jgi:hypothetical protein
MRVLVGFFVVSSMLVGALPVRGGDAPAVGTNAGDLCPDFELFDTEGAPVRLSDFRGRVVFLWLFASW